MANEEERGSRPAGPVHTVHLSNRESVVIHGVLHVDSFDDQEVILATELGTLTMKGKDLRIKQLDLDKGSFAVEGLIYNLAYSEGGMERPKAKNLFGRILR